MYIDDINLNIEVNKVYRNSQVRQMLLIAFTKVLFTLYCSFRVRKVKWNK
jgi:hypothetical protein